MNRPPRKPINSRFLRTLVGYNARRASLQIMGVFIQRMAPLDLRPVDFSVLCLIGHNPGITSREICRELHLLAPNLVRLLARLDQRALVRRQAHPEDGRAVGLSLSEGGQALLAQAECEVAALEVDVTADLSDAERAQLIALLQRVYR
ncbi:MarR family winged helix-turn-helix transcriptional regulator [Ottowia sp.]|uniref:MarR family winged helix-turn-helix transcriptional regulator n=1 Tax=Ottowia sp. TaxID=1898956 RepID=UPI003A87AEF7